MAKTIMSIGLDIPSLSENFLKIDSYSSLADADIAVFCPNLFYASYSTFESFSSGEYNGKKLYNKQSSADISSHANHWKSELVHFVNSGKTLFVILCKKEDFYIHTGTRDVSGTGRNQKVTDHVTSYSNYDFLHLKSMIVNQSTGQYILPANPLFSEFYSNFKEYLSFECHITGDNLGEVIFTSKDKNRVLGLKKKYKDGNLIILPNLNFFVDDLKSYNKENEVENWNNEAIRLGKLFCNSIIEIDKAIKGNDERSVVPSWVHDREFSIKESEITQLLIDENNKLIKKKEEENLNLDKIKKEQESLKDLLFETGKLLETAVRKAFTILGYKAEGFDDGELELDQIIVSPEGERYIGECEGKDNKDIDVSKFRQLLDGLNADFEREEVTEKAIGLLIGNPQRLIKPNDRTLDFTQKCRSGAKRENIGLIKTADLYRICKYIREHEDAEYKYECRKAISEGLGSVIIFPIPPNEN